MPKGEVGIIAGVERCYANASTALSAVSAVARSAGCRKAGERAAVTGVSGSVWDACGAGSAADAAEVAPVEWKRLELGVPSRGPRFVGAGLR